MATGDGELDELRAALADLDDAPTAGPPSDEFAKQVRRVDALERAVRFLAEAHISQVQAEGGW